MLIKDYLSDGAPSTAAALSFETMIVAGTEALQNPPKENMSLLLEAAKYLTHVVDPYESGILPSGAVVGLASIAAYWLSQYSHAHQLKARVVPGTVEADANVSRHTQQIDFILQSLANNGLALSAAHYAQAYLAGVISKPNLEEVNAAYVFSHFEFLAIPLGLLLTREINHNGQNLINDLTLFASSFLGFTFAPEETKPIFTPLLIGSFVNLVRTLKNVLIHNMPVKI